MTQEGDETITPVQQQQQQQPGTSTSETKPEMTRQLSRMLKRGMSQVKEEAQDFLFITQDSKDKLKERRRAVLSRRFCSKAGPQAPPTQFTKPPVLKITVDGISKIKRKTQSVIQNKDLEQGDIRRAENTREALHATRTCKFAVDGPQMAMTPPDSKNDSENVVLLSGLGLQPPQDEPDAIPHMKGKNWIFKRDIASDNLQKQRRQFTFFNAWKRLFQLEDVSADEYRPIFTYYVTVTQLLILVFSLSIYGFAPWGISTTRRQELVMVTSLTLENVDYEERQNIWLGNREADLIHLGARFTPCMRDDPGIKAEIVRDIVRERDTACCIRHDRSGCVQTQKDQCSENLSTWHKVKSMPSGAMVGSVCGQDPRYCDEPPSIEPYRWPDDFTKWPKCRKQHPPSSVRNGDLADENAHMACQVVGRPCCIGTYGQCEITTREYCEFVQGTFHEEAALCSQVSCLQDVCGMFPFIRSPSRPDQLYRLLTSLFLHAGIIHFLLTAILQLWWMRDLERIYGPHRIGAIYILSGVGGNLASASFVPYRADVGPSAALFGIMAIFIVDVIDGWNDIHNKWHAIAQAVSPIIVGFICGWTPWTDNFGHAFGLLIGFLLAMIPHDRQIGQRFMKRRAFMCTFSLLIAFVSLFVWFQLFPDYRCTFCHYFTCLPQLFKEACETHQVNYKPRHKLHF